MKKCLLAIALCAVLIFPAAGKAEQDSADSPAKTEAVSKADDAICQALKRGDFSRFAGTYELAYTLNSYYVTGNLTVTKKGEVSGGRTDYGRSMWSYGKAPVSVEQMTFGGRKFYRCVMKSFQQTTGDGNKITASIYFDIFPAGVKAAIVPPSTSSNPGRDLDDTLMTQKDSIVFQHYTGAGPLYEGYTAKAAPVSPTPTPAPASLRNQKITVKKSWKKAFGSSDFSLQAKTSGNGKLSYSSNNNKVAVVSAKGKVTIKGTGKAVITVKAARTSTFKAASAKVTVIVYPKKNKLTAKNAGGGVCALSWKKDTRADGFILRISNNKNFKGSRDYTMGKTKQSYKIKNLSGSYYMKIMAYKTIDKRKYGKWSDAVMVKVKK